MLESADISLPDHRRRKTVTSGQKPLPAADSLKLAQVPNGFAISLFADKLSTLTSAVFINGGLISTNGPGMNFLTDTNPKLVPADLASLLADLTHPNLFWRPQDQRCREIKDNRQRSEPSRHWCPPCS